MTAPEIAPGTRIGDFVVEGLVGRGGMGEVYRATQIRLDRPVALKVLAAPLAAQHEVAARFTREATTMRDLEHPAIVPVYDAGDHGGTRFLAMRLLETATLRDRLRDGPLPAPDTLEILHPLAGALDHAHGHGVVHRDVKPANVLLDRAGRPFLADFGIAKALDAVSVTVSGSSLGTPLYMAPEQAGGRAGHRSDLYSFGCMAFEMLTGAPPYPLTEPVPLLLAHAQAPVPAASELRPGLPRAVDAVFRRALAKAPEHRYGSAAEFVGELGAALGSPAAGTAGGVAAGPVRPPPWSGRRRTWVAAAAVVAALVAVSTLAYALRPAPVSAPAAVPAAPAAASTLPPPPAPGPPDPPPVPHGDLLFGPVLDGSGTGFLDNLRQDPDPDQEVIRHLPGAIELEALAPRAYNYLQLDLDRGFTTYVADLDVTIRPGSDLELCWSLRWGKPGELAWYWCLHAPTQTAEFRRFDGDGMVPISSTTNVPGLQEGRTAHVTLVVREQELEMYLDGELVVSATDDSVPVNRTLPGLEMDGDDGTGLVRIEEISYWMLPA